MEVELSTLIIVNDSVNEVQVANFFQFDTLIAFLHMDT